MGEGKWGKGEWWEGGMGEGGNGGAKKIGGGNIYQHSPRTSFFSDTSASSISLLLHFLKKIFCLSNHPSQLINNACGNTFTICV